jgi:hypothetical protein
MMTTSASPFSASSACSRGEGGSDEWLHSAVFWEGAALDTVDCPSPSDAPTLSPLRTRRADHPGFSLDDSWHKVKLKTSDPSTASPAGLVPASYLAPVPALRTTTALYDYAPARDESTGELENDEEMDIAEGEELEVLEEESEWVLCRKTGGTKGVGYVPATYIEVR